MLNIALLPLHAHHLHFSNELAQRLDNLSVTPAAADENASVENRWCQLGDTVQSTALAVLSCARRQLRDWFDDKDAAFRNLLAEKNSLHIAYLHYPHDANKAAFYQCRRLTVARNAGRLGGSQGQLDPEICRPQGIKELLR
ncbi:hypothetical protein SprV_1002822200 [Sparganum proliferum]